MADFPGTIWSPPVLGALMSDAPTHSTNHNDVNDEVEAIESTLGINPHGPFATVAQAIVPTAWTAVTFINSWVNEGGAIQTVQYRKIGDIVYLRGSMKSGTLGQAAFVLPAGFRPPANLRAPAMSLVGSIATAARADISTGGSYVASDGSNSAAWWVDFHFSVTA